MLPHDFIEIDGVRQCHIHKGLLRQQHLLQLQTKIGKPHKWEQFHSIFDIPVPYSTAEATCTTVHPIVSKLGCAFEGCASLVSAIRTVNDRVLCLGALNDYHTNLLQNCSRHMRAARRLWEAGLKPKRMKNMRNCTCEYTRISDTNSTPGRMTFGECSFESINDVWRDQVCCATCTNIQSVSQESSFWQQIQRLHQQYLRGLRRRRPPYLAQRRQQVHSPAGS